MPDSLGMKGRWIIDHIVCSTSARNPNPTDIHPECFCVIRVSGQSTICVRRNRRQLISLFESRMMGMKFGRVFLVALTCHACFCRQRIADDNQQ